MPKQSGLGDNFYINGVDLSGDIASLGKIGGGPAALEITGINKYAMERIGGLRDGGIEFQSFFNPTTAHPALSDLPRGDVVASYHRGTVIGGQAAACIAKQVNYDGSREDDGGFKFDVELQSNGYGLEWGRQGTAGIRTDNAATPASGAVAIDNGAAAVSGAFGLQVYLQVFSFTGTSCTVKLQQSSDNGADAYTDITGAAFTPVTAAGAQRIQTARTLATERYYKVVTTGTFSECSFAVIIVRNPVDVGF